MRDAPYLKDVPLLDVIDESPRKLIVKLGWSKASFKSL